MAVQGQQRWPMPLRAREDTVTHELTPRARPLSVGPSTNGIAPCVTTDFGLGHFPIPLPFAQEFPLSNMKVGVDVMTAAAVVDVELVVLCDLVSLWNRR
jgi:hypothetical protein